MTLTNKEKAFCKRYVQDFNGTQSAIDVGYSPKTARTIASQNLSKLDIQEEIKSLVKDYIMGENEILIEMTKIGRGNMATFFKIVEEWTFYPLPTYDIIDAREVDVLDEEGNTTGDKKVSYWVRHAVIDIDKVADPKYAGLIKEFSDSRKDGLGIKLHDKMTALQFQAKLSGLVTEKVDVTTKGEKVTADDRYDRAISTLADAIREILPGEGAGTDSDLDAPK